MDIPPFWFCIEFFGEKDIFYYYSIVFVVCPEKGVSLP